MFREQHRYIKAYLKIAGLNKGLFAVSLVTAVLYKLAAIMRPFAAAMIIKALTDQDAEKAYLYTGLYFAVYFFYRAMFFLNYRAYSWNISYCYQHLQTKVFNKLTSIDGDFTRTISKGQLMNTINSDLLEIGEMNDEISEYFTTFFQILGVLIISARYSIIVAVLMVISCIVMVYMRTKHDRIYNHYWWKTQIKNDEYSNFLGQVVTGLQEVKTFDMLTKLRQHLSRIQTSYNKFYIIQRKHFTRRDNDVRATFYIFRALILIMCICLMSRGSIEVDILVLLYSYHEQVIDYVRDFTDATVDIRLTHAAIRRVTSILNYHPSKAIEYGDLNLDHINGSIRFKNVSLMLNKRKILKNLNFKIKPHEFVAVVGYPGSGKTKLFDLILRINKPTHGTVFLDDINIYEFTREVYTSNVAVANQMPFIFNTSIRKNLNLVDTNIEHQIKACKIAGIHDFIETLPLGYNTILRENANNISGGQRQMISIARTLLTDAEVLLLDDVTTSLDPDTAELVPNLISRIRDKRTIVMITKKPELMKLADRIIVLDHGRISDIGTHQKLLERSPLYRSLQALKSEPGGI